jgi:hypothetical protein
VLTKRLVHQSLRAELNLTQSALGIKLMIYASIKLLTVIRDIKHASVLLEACVEQMLRVYKHIPNL